MKKKTDTKAIIAGICFLLIIIFGCINLMGGLTRERDVAEEPVTPLPLQIPGQESAFVKTLCLEVSQVYPDERFGFFKKTLVNLGMNITPRQFSFPYESTIIEVLQGIGVQVVEEDSQCDARLTIEVNGTSNGRIYGNILTKQGENKCYTDSYINGNLVISFKDNDSYQTKISGQVQSPDAITSRNCPDQPYKAPFLDSSAETLTDALVSLWGPDIAKVIYDRYRRYDGDINEALTTAAKNVLSNDEENVPTMPAAEPTTKPLP